MESEPWQNYFRELRKMLREKSFRPQAMRLMQDYEDSGNRLSPDPTNQELLNVFGALFPPPREP